VFRRLSSSSVVDGSARTGEIYSMQAETQDLPFKGPLCGSSKYVQVFVKRPSGNWYRTEFYRCFGCSVMFTDPVAPNAAQMAAG